MLRRLFLVLTACFLAACSGDSSVTPDHKALESPTGEAVLRHVLGLCPHRTEAKQLTIVLGPLQDSASPEFETKFADTGLIVTPSTVCPLVDSFARPKSMPFIRFEKAALYSAFGNTLR